MTKRFQVVVVTVSTCLLALLIVGAVLGQGGSAQDAYRQFAVFSEVLTKIKSDYVEEPDMKNVALGALNGLLESIDPFSSYLTADQYKSYLKARETKKGDVGLILSRRGYGYIGVVDAIPGSPADKLGLTTGDVLETIGAVSTRDMPLAYAEVLLVGDPGTSVELTVLRVRRGAEGQKVALVRAPVKDPPVTGKALPDGIGWLQVHTLEEGKSKEVAAQIGALKQQGVKKLILDLRHNASGLVDEGIALADLFMEKGLITYLQGQKVPRRDFEAQSGRTVWGGSLVVLTNRGTAGGAEVAATALLDSKRAEVVGERTYGEAAQRKALTMDDGSAVILAVAKYYGPGGKSIPDNGVTPSLVVNEQEPQGEPDDEPLAAPPPKSPDEDIQLKKAIEVITVGLAAAKQNDRLRAEQAAGVRREPAGRPSELITPVGPLGVPRPPQ